MKNICFNNIQPLRGCVDGDCFIAGISYPAIHIESLRDSAETTKCNSIFKNGDGKNLIERQQS